MERLDILSRCNAHLMDWICDCDDCNSDRITACRDAKKEIERLRNAIEQAGRCLAMSNNGKAEALAILRAAKSTTDHPAEGAKP